MNTTMKMELEVKPGLVLKPPLIIGAVVRLTVARVAPTDPKAAEIAGLSPHMWRLHGDAIAREMS